MHQVNHNWYPDTSSGTSPAGKGQGMSERHTEKKILTFLPS